MYTSFTIYPHPKEKDRWRIESTHKREDDMGTWEGGGTWGDLYKVSGMFVIINPLSQKPVGVFPSIESLAEALRGCHKCEVTVR